MIKIIRSNPDDREQIFSIKETKVDVSAIVSEIIDKVRREGDEALYYYLEKFDKVRPDSLRVSEEEIDAALLEVSPELIRVLQGAAENIRAFHEMQRSEGFRLERREGVIVGQKVIPIERAGLYVPGGTAAYPSTVLMDAIPAKIAGVSEIIMVTPPDKNGNIPSAILSESALGFLGLGIEKPMASWGLMVNTGRQYLYTNPWLSLAPSIAIMIIVLAFNFLGDGLRDVLDPHLENQ